MFFYKMILNKPYTFIKTKNGEFTKFALLFQKLSTTTK